jgi:cytochrome c oxidase assembly factor CtaG
MIPSATAAGPRSIWSILRAWNADPIALILLVLAGWAYVAAVRFARESGYHHAPARRALFLSGVGVIALALLSPIDAYANLLLSVHMVQHLLLTMVAPPLLLLGAPVTVALRAGGPRGRRRVLLPVLRSRLARALSNPVISWTLFAAVMWGTHFSPIYEATLTNHGIHVLEHVAYLGAGVLFWAPVVGRDPVPWRIGYPARILYTFLAMPQLAFLGLAIAGAGRVLYPAYVLESARLGVSALADQHLAGSIMWETGAVLMLPALGLVLADWLASEERRGAAHDAALDHPRTA